MEIILTEEQENFVLEAQKGNNILVDACIGSGKTTAIQHACNRIDKNKKILYLTYNKLLKMDAKEKIKNKNVLVQNYHGFAYECLKEIGISVSPSDLIQRFLKEKISFSKYDILMIDEYQDINEEISNLLKKIKRTNPKMQIIVVGDMKQKIYDWTSLQVENFINDFLGEYKTLEFTFCFRLNKEYANDLSFAWKKSIIGVNKECKVSKMDFWEAIKFLKNEKYPKDVLVLGQRTGKMVEALNILEKECPWKYNKYSTYATIRDKSESDFPRKNSAIFTTYDQCKGIEREDVIIFDFDSDYYEVRKNHGAKYTILRNLFCVAASRGKRNIIFVKNDSPLITKEILASNFETMQNDVCIENISTCFDYKYKEQVEKCFNMLKITKIENYKENKIDINLRDGNIDLSPCIGIFQEAFFFEKYNIEKEIELLVLTNHIPDFNLAKAKKMTMKEKVLFLTSLKTKQNRYFSQVKEDYIPEMQKNEIFERLSSIFSKEETVQQLCQIDFSEFSSKKLKVLGFCDVVKENAVYELKFVSTISHEHFLQCALYMIGLNLKKGILYNTRNNEFYEIMVPQKKKFLKQCAIAILKE